MELIVQQTAFFEKSPDIAKGVKGRLFRHFQFWKSMGANLFAQNGYVIPFVTIIPFSMKIKKTNKFAIKRNGMLISGSGCVHDDHCPASHGLPIQCCRK